MNNKTVLWTVVIIALVIGGYYFFNHQTTQEQTVAEEQTPPTKEELQAQAFAKKNDAVIDWTKDITYTVEAQDRLLVSKPILFTASVDDIYKQDNKTRIRLSSSSSFPSYVLDLECDPKLIIGKIFTPGEATSWDKYFNDYLVVANVTSVTKPALALKADPISEEEAEIEVDSDVSFVVRGTCVDIEQVIDDNE